MYCKFCGIRLLPNVSKCSSCGADIDFKDGGQTFFEDNELEEWRVESPVKPPVTSMPTPEPVFQRSYSIQPPEKVSAKKRAPHSNSKKRKYTLTTNGKLIGGCIIIALVVVLLAAAITSVNNNRADSDDETVPTESAAETVLVSGARIMIDGSEVAVPGNVYLMGDVVFVSMDKVLEHANFTYEPTAEGNVVRYVRESETDRVIVEVVQGANEMRYNGISSELTYNSFTVVSNSDTYVPAASFFEKLGYTSNYFESTKILSVETKVR